MSQEIIVLPEREEMQKILVATRNRPIYIKKLYPVLLEKGAGSSSYVEDFAAMISLTFSNFGDEVGVADANQAYDDLEDFIDALVTDKELAQAVKTDLEAFHKISTTV